MNNKKLPHQILYELGEFICNQDTIIESKKITKLVDTLLQCKDLDRFNLTEDELPVIASAWYDMIENSCNYWDAIDLLKMVYPPKSTCLNKLPVIIGLLEKKVIYTEKRTLRNAARKKLHIEHQSPVISFSSHSLLENGVVFHRDFVKTLLDETDDIEHDGTSPYSNNKEFLNDWMVYLKKLEELSWHDYEDRQLNANIEVQTAQDLIQVIDHKNLIDSRLEITKQNFPLNELVDEYQLDENETVILVYLVKQELDGNESNSDTILKMISNDQHEHYLNRKYLNPDGRLISNGLVDKTDSSFMMIRGNSYRLMPDVMRRIITNSPLNDSERMDLFLRGNNLFDLKDVNQSFDSLILAEELKKTIKVSLKTFNLKTTKVLKNWQLFGEDNKLNRQQNLLILLHGEPGTGKTFAAGAIANSLGKKILTSNAALLQSKWVGDSEKNIRRLFIQYEKISRMMNNPPILLINEADQLFSNRFSSTKSSVDVMHNSMQNLLLEGLETFNGLLIATTNH
ncbi:MAG: AAA family ATPase, partial [Cytophagia bacterium]|nr:AAA family ATPase [Cytophagia bacterium]